MSQALLPLKSAPVQDRITYEVWKRHEEAHTLLTKILSVCIQNRRTSASWKTSSTILIHKKGDESQPGNWRPISLQPTIYKIYATILARRLADWAINGNRIHPVQKGFLPYEECAEHSFILRSVLEDSKRRCRNVCVVWLDLKNAFGSVPHSTMWEIMKRLDVPSEFLEICHDIYNDSAHTVRSEAGTTLLIPLNQGIKQGCPLSPLLFNLVLEGIIPKLASFEGYKFQGGAQQY